MTTSLEQSRAQLISTAAHLGQRSGGPDLEAFLGRYYRHVATDDLLARAPEDLLGAALSHRELARERAVGSVNAAAFNPSVDAQGWSSGHTVVQVVCDDMPFLVDSVTSELGRESRAVHLVVHPLLVARRTIAGHLEEILDLDPPGPHEFGTGVESWIHVEIDRASSAAELEEIAARLTEVLGNVRDAVEDWPKMRERVRSIADGLRHGGPAGIPQREVDETVAFLDWMVDDRFTLLGYREYALEREEDHDLLRTQPSSGLGLLRYDTSQSGSFARLGPLVQAKAREKRLLIITKANTRATVHRSVYLDYVGVKVFDDAGEVVGEQRILGLFASSAYNASVLDIPIMADRVNAVLHLAGFTHDSHSGKDLLQVLESYPRDELFQTSVEKLLDVASSVLHAQERRKTQLFLRKDDYGRFMSCLVFIPRARYNTPVRLKIESLLREAFHAVSVDYTTRVTESSLARLHFVVRVRQGEVIPDVDEPGLTRAIVEAARTWDEDLAEAARTEYGEEGAARLMGLYSRAFPEAYKEDFGPRVAVADVRFIESLTALDSTGLNMYQEPGAPSHERRFKL
ncbi:MAG TPA: hypothetical protein VHM65_03420, partial [Candidatus Lustribacter sp.]|nr:hypothetical protein [Candidatus Lustribacter sp.]